MEESVSLVFGIHNHQPVGNFDHIFEEAYRTAYSPFIQVLSEFPDIRISFHMTGVLCDWFDANHPEFLDLIAAMVARGQLEIMTGGYYEPIMPIVPDRDKKGQIRKLSRYVRARFGCKPTGMWLAERVWEPYLAKPIAEAGVRYVAMDDSHFKAAGLSGDELLGYYRTEEQGTGLAIFPISEKLRYLIPFQFPEKTIEYLRQFVTPTGYKMVVFADDGEKFGVWPGTHQWVYVEGWLRKFFGALSENRSWLRVMPFSEALREHASLGPIYIPTASYTEMMEWVLPPNRTLALQDLLHRPDSEPYRPFLRGGFWRNYLAKYRESNNLHKKMLYVSEKVARLKGQARSAAEDFLWAGQCNCGYWHGVFGGLYLNHIRSAIYRNLIAAEVEVDRLAAPDKPWATVSQFDFFRDGGRTTLLETGALSLYFDVQQGAALFELDHKGKHFNLLNTLTRRPEAYHLKITQAHKNEKPEDETQSIHDLVRVKEQGLEEHLHYDWYRRSAFIDHFLGASVALEDFRRSQYAEEGDFVNQPYEVASVEDAERIILEFSREGAVRRDGGVYPVSLMKTIEVHPDSPNLRVGYRIENRSRECLNLRFAAEFGFSLQAGNTPDRYYRFDNSTERPLLGTIGERKNVRVVSLFEEWLGLEVRLGFECPFTLWHFPIETVSSSEAGFERTYQSSVVLPIWSFRLEPGDEWEMKGTLNLIDLSR